MAWWKGRKKGEETTEVSARNENEAPGGAQNKAQQNGEAASAPQTRRRPQEADEHQRKNGHSRIFKQLVASLKDRDAAVRAHAAWSLGRMGDARAVEPLVGLLNDKDADVRRDVAEALKRLGWKNKSSN